MDVETVALLGQMFLRWLVCASKDHVLWTGALSRHLYISLNCLKVPGVWWVFSFFYLPFPSKTLCRLNRSSGGEGLCSLGFSILESGVGDPAFTKAGES